VRAHQQPGLAARRAARSAGRGAAAGKTGATRPSWRAQYWFPRSGRGTFSPQRHAATWLDCGGNPLHRSGSAAFVGAVRSASSRRAHHGAAWFDSDGGFHRLRQKHHLGVHA
jgi:hypothetical protein